LDDKIIKITVSEDPAGVYQQKDWLLWSWYVL